MKDVVEERAVRGDDELELRLTGFDQSSQVDGQLDQVVFIQRAHRVINKDVGQIVEDIGGALGNFWKVQLGNYLLQKCIEYAPDEVAFFALGDLDVGRWLLIPALEGKAD
jgi:hypothetical protein